MTTISLPPDIERPLIEEAQRRGTTPEALAIDCLRRAFPVPNGARPPEGSLLDELIPFVGVVEGSGEALSEHCGERFAKALEQRRSEPGP